jgi:hypothetical protein
MTAAPGGWYYSLAPHGRNLYEDEVSVAPISFRLGSVENEIVNLVKKLCAPLFIIFDYQEFSDDIYHRIVTDFLSGRPAVRV